MTWPSLIDPSSVHTPVAVLFAKNRTLASHMVVLTPPVCRLRAAFVALPDETDGIAGSVGADQKTRASGTELFGVLMVEK